MAKHNSKSRSLLRARDSKSRGFRNARSAVFRPRTSGWRVTRSIVTHCVWLAFNRAATRVYTVAVVNLVRCALLGRIARGKEVAQAVSLPCVSCTLL